MPVSDANTASARSLTPRAPAARDTRAPRRRAPAATSSAPARAAIVRDDACDARTAASGERQPVDRAREQVVRVGRAPQRRRPPAARVPTRRARETGSDASPGPAASSSARGRGTAMTRSNRSSSARESLSRYAASRWAEHEHSALGSPRAPHGQRFMVATSWKRAGKIARPAARAMQTKPSSSGCLNASSVGRGNSASSSSSSTPRCARLASPGRIPGPPPTTAAVDAL